MTPPVAAAALTDEILWALIEQLIAQGLDRDAFIARLETSWEEVKRTGPRESEVDKLRDAMTSGLRSAIDRLAGQDHLVTMPEAK
jgi:hypothetical protein